MPDIQKISVALTAEQVRTLKTVVDTGEYATASEVVREALREWQRLRELRAEELNRLRRLWDEGIASGDAGPVDFEVTRKLARQRLARARERAA